MPLYEDITREVDEGPAGPRIAALFDVDRTLVAGFSAVEFVREGIRSGLMKPLDVASTLAAAAAFQLGGVGFSSFVVGTSTALRGVSEADFIEMGERIFRERLAGEIFPEARALIRAHRRKGHTIALVSSATRYQVGALARELEIEHVLCTALELRDGRFTGSVVMPTCYGPGKATAARGFAEEHGVDLAESWFYSDSDEDLPLLELVGRPRPLNPGPRLAAIARRRGWPMRTFGSRGMPALSDVFRTGLAIGSLFPSVGLGLPLLALEDGWRHMVNFAIGTWGELGAAIAGVRVRVTGEEHLWSHRPAVFVFNHQSSLDMLLLAKLLRRDIIGVAKHEVRSNPLWGPAMALAGTVFIDRSNREKAIEALAPAIEALRGGRSIVIAPEGTRSVTPRLGRFKKGAFHIAMAARVPIVPIVFRNAADAMPKNALIVRPTVVEAVVLPPIATDRWTARGLDAEIEKVRGRFEEVLAGELRPTRPAPRRRVRVAAPSRRRTRGAA